MSPSQDPNVPKQAILKDPTLYAKFTAGSTRQVAEKVLDFLPAPTSSSVIHDNGCGAGEVTRGVMARGPRSGIHIKATDIDQMYLDQLRTTVLAEEWPVEVSHMPSEKLTFADDTFTLSIANFVIFLTPEGGIPALKEVYRTLKPAGSFAHTTWSQLAVQEPVKTVHAATRPTDSAPVREIPAEWTSSSHLVDIIAEAGFPRENVKLKTVLHGLKIEDFDQFVTMMWSYLGGPITGWLPSDEANWEKQTKMLGEEIKKTKGFRQDADGKWIMESIANVVIATK